LEFRDGAGLYSHVGRWHVWRLDLCAIGGLRKKPAISGGFMASHGFGGLTANEVIAFLIAFTQAEDWKDDDTKSSLNDQMRLPDDVSKVSIFVLLLLDVTYAIRRLSQETGADAGLLQTRIDGEWDSIEERLTIRVRFFELEGTDEEK